jgi:hypothetical protein
VALKLSDTVCLLADISRVVRSGSHTCVPAGLSSPGGAQSTLYACVLPAAVSKVFGLISAGGVVFSGVQVGPKGSAGPH